MPLTYFFNKRGKFIFNFLISFKIFLILYKRYDIMDNLTLDIKVKSHYRESALFINM